MLLVTPGREAAIDNIRRAATEGRFNDKTEPFDPQWAPAELKAEILRLARHIDSPLQRLKRFTARKIVDSWIRRWSDGVNDIEGLERLSALKGPAFLTSNHFNPFDNGIHRTLAQRCGRGPLVAVSQGTNYVMPGLNGFILRNIDTIPLIPEASCSEAWTPGSSSSSTPSRKCGSTTGSLVPKSAGPSFLQLNTRCPSCPLS